ncbi:molybdopterin-dependent oxidoreductase [uncultured Adlercreutzia sp.]|uniref:molybdopterin-dependent oxidoreductase n=1 Tax=uncultured Adlercreutzia sp. TaxID=875803 RepID=UPI0025FE5E4C|nr:molybdopterin-dependent oxidoreductase [uncultured Adlercreutzia sp.]
MDGLFGNIGEITVDRRTLLSSVAAVSASVSLAGCAPALQEAAVDAPLPSTEAEGTWISCECNNKGCGGGPCVNKVYVVDGVPLRQKTDDTHEDSPEYPQRRGCARGRSMRHNVLGPHRLKYPMKRKGWSPDNPNGEKRGVDEWERISWDEALDYVAEELRKLYENYGPRSMLHAGYGGANESYHLLNALGGFCYIQDTASCGSFALGPLTIGTGFTYNAGGAFGGMTVNDRRDLLNSETIVLYGCNPSWAAAGNPTYWYMQAKNAGAEIVYVGPDYNVTASTLQARWIRVRPGTDIAFLLSVAYVMLTTDDPDANPIIDWDYIDRCTIGFYDGNMPENASVDENFADYVMGKYDGIPKTPEWATEICGTPVEDIEWYANAIRKDRKVSIHFSYAAGRTNDSEDFHQLLMTIGAMGGHYGKPGHSCGLGAYLLMAGNEGPYLINGGGTKADGSPISTFTPNPIDEAIPAHNIWQSVLDGKYHYCGNTASSAGTLDTLVPGEWRDIDIHMVWYDFHGAEKLPDVGTQVEVLRKVDFVVTIDYVFSTAAKYSDIILPVPSKWERYVGASGGDRECFKVPSRVMEPMYETRLDQDIVKDLMTRLGIDPMVYFPCDEKERYFYTLAGATILEPDGVTVSPLVTITKEDAAAWGAEWPEQEGKIGLQELIDKGSYQVELSDDDNYGYIGYAEFREDPENNPRQSESGKQEVYCQVKADKFNAIGFMDRVIKPYPTYYPAHSGYESSFADWETKTKGEYPFQMFTPHYIGRCHNDLTQMKQVREAFISPGFINAQDAEEKGIKDGDTVLFYNDNGKVLRIASVSNCIMPGCVSLPHGGWVDFDEENGIDRGGNENVLIGHSRGTFPLTGYNTTLINFEKYDGEPLAPYHELTVTTPEV